MTSLKYKAILHSLEGITLLQKLITVDRIRKKQILMRTYAIFSFFKAFFTVDACICWS